MFKVSNKDTRKLKMKLLPGIFFDTKNPKMISKMP